MTFVRRTSKLLLPQLLPKIDVFHFAHSSAKFQKAIGCIYTQIYTQINRYTNAHTHCTFFEILKRAEADITTSKDRRHNHDCHSAPSFLHHCFRFELEQYELILLHPLHRDPPHRRNHGNCACARWRGLCCHRQSDQVLRQPEHLSI